MSSESGRSEFAWGCLLGIAMLVYGGAQIYAGIVGIKFHLGLGWAIAAAVAALFFRFTLPITIGSFFGAMNVWGWHWALALIFAAPGLAFMALMIPGVLAGVTKRIRG